MTVRTLRNVPIGLAVAGLLVGCGSSGGAGTGTTPTQPATALKAADYVLGHSSALAGFSYLAHTPSDDPTDKQIDDCFNKAIGSSTPTGTAKADSDDFTRDTTREAVSSSAEVHTAAEVASDIEQVRSGAYLTKGDACITQALGPGRTVDLGGGQTGTFGPLRALPASTTPDVIGGFRFTVSLAGVQVVSDVILQARGRVETTLTLTRQGAYPNAALSRVLATQISGKLANQ